VEGPLWNFFEEECAADTGMLLSEDFSFCQKWRSLGGELTVIDTIETLHWGSAAWEWPAPKAGRKAVGTIGRLAA
jgi:hypothetical protein